MLYIRPRDPIQCARRYPNRWWDRANPVPPTMRLMVEDLDRLVEDVAWRDRVFACRVEARDKWGDFVDLGSEEQRQDRGVVDHQRLRLVVQGNLLVLVRLGGCLREQGIEVGIAVLAVVVPTVAGE